jgi:hypothetical protein
MTFSYAALAEEFSNFMQCTMFFQFRGETGGTAKFSKISLF